MEMQSGAHVLNGSTTSFSFSGGGGGEIVLDENRFRGTIVGFAASDTIDLRAMSWAQSPHIVSYNSNNNMLTVAAGTDTAKLTILGAFAQANFQLADDHSGGTLIQYHSTGP